MSGCDALQQRPHRAAADVPAFRGEMLGVLGLRRANELLRYAPTAMPALEAGNFAAFKANMDMAVEDEVLTDREHTEVLGAMERSHIPIDSDT
jgi:hypothetical protein